MKKSMKKIGWIGLVCVMILNFCLTPLLSLPVNAENEQSGEQKFQYYYNQLTTAEARGIYNILAKLLQEGKLQDGKYTVDLVAEKVLENKFYDKNVLMADFISARDAFMLDNNVFYINFDKLSLTQTQDVSGNYSIQLGIGRDTNYFYDGFDKDNVATAIEEFNQVVDEIANLASGQEEIEDKIKIVYDAIQEKISYALEEDAQPENVLYVRTPYGALVKGESVCEGYARALKAVLDKLGIDNVLVQGMYVDGNNLEPHMWNYVKMDDNRWYLLDATAEDGVQSETDNYFLKIAQDDVLKYYQPDGVISLSTNSFEFAYPDLSVMQYKKLCKAFTVTETAEEYVKHISYNGKGVGKTEEEEKYILASFNGTDWYYYKNYVQYANLLMSKDHTDTSYDYDTYFVEGFRMAYFAVTNVQPTVELNTEDSSTWISYITYEGDMYDVSKVSDVIEYGKVAPVAVTKEPTNSRLEGGKTYDVKVTYSEALKLANSASNANVKWATQVEGATITDFNWDGNKTVTFKMTTVNTYNFVTGYYFVLENLIGVESLLAPQAVGFNVVNNPSFACPKIEGDVNKVFANTPALIADSNLEENEWKDENGNPISSSLPNRLTLVATTITGEAEKALVDEIKNAGNEVLASQTYNISLGLCSNQIAYVTGMKVKVFVPFPAGYNATSNVTFKAFHFDKNGTPEEITCVTTEHGIIMMCDKFSDFAVIATNATVSERDVITVANGNGTFDKESLKVTENGEGTVTITADNGYVIDSISLNGEAVTFDNNKTFTVNLSYEDLNANGNILEASFVLEQGYKAEIITTTPTISIGETTKISVGVSHTTDTYFAAGEIIVTYDTTKLTFNQSQSTLGTATVKLENGTLTLEDYGADKLFSTDNYVLAFDAISDGETTVTMVSASFVNKENASKSDLIPALLQKDTVNVTISKNIYSVTLPNIFTGNSVVTHGENYTFTVTDGVNYDYKDITATVDGETVTVEKDGNNYTISNVTGTLVISGTRTAKTYDVSFAGNAAEDITNAGNNATYNTNYQFTMPTKDGWSYTLESITIGGVVYNGYEVQNQVYTILGSAIAGNIVITVKKVETSTSVTVEGNGAGAATGYNPVATLGESYTLTIAPEADFDYEVTATMKGANVTLEKDGNSYTISNVTGAIVFTVKRTVGTGNVTIGQYMELNGSIVWLVQNKATLSVGKVYTYDGNVMFWSDEYQAYCYLVISPTLALEDAKEFINISDGAVITLGDEMDINGTGKVDASDAQMVYNMYNSMYSEWTDEITIEQFLRADVNKDGVIDVRDSAMIINKILE